jgi:hypothetical protein
MKIPHEVITDCYKYSKQAYDEQASSNDFVNKLLSKHTIKVNSAKDYFYFYNYLISGLGSCRILSSYTQEYFLKRIYEDYGKEQLKKSLKAFGFLIEKFEGEKVGSRKSMRAIYDKYMKLV